MYNKTQEGARTRSTTPPVACITKPMVTGGRPTDDPKATLVALRLAARQVRVLAQRSRREDTGLSEAIRSGGGSATRRFEPQPDGFVYNKTNRSHV